MGGEAEDYLSQTFTLPADKPYIVLYFQLFSTDPDPYCLWNEAGILLNDIVVDSGPLCQANNRTGWVLEAFDARLYGGQPGQPVTLKLAAVQSNAYPSYFYVDDVSVSASVPPGATQSRLLAGQ
jgi:hypothetical protein